MQILIDGLVTGLTISLLALAFSVVYLPTRVFYIALGGVYSFVPFVAWTCIHRGCPLWIGVLIAIAVGVGLSILCELGVHAALSKRNASSAVHLVSSLGTYIVIVQAIVFIWGSESRTLRQGIDSVINIGHSSVTHSQGIAALTSLFLLVIICLWLRLSRHGLHCRAMSDNPNEFGLRGYNLTRMRILAFAVAGFLASVCSVITAYDLGFAPHAGLMAILLAVVAVITGGRSSFAGPVIGGLLLGLIRTGMLWLTSAAWQDATTFVILGIVLFARPEGLLVAKHRLESWM